LYHHAVRPLGSDGDGLLAMLHDGDIPLGRLVFTRGGKETEFSRADSQVLARLLPHIAHAWVSPNCCEGPWIDSKDSGLILMNPAGDVLHLCPVAKHLLFYAAQSRAPKVDWKDTRTITQALCRQLQAVFRGVEGAAPPAWQRQNAFGRFVFRAYRLNAAPLAQDELIGVTVQRQVPLQVKLLERMDSLPLSPREQEICLLLAQGLSYAAIAEKLYRSERTVITHAQNIFAKLEVENRAGLSGKLLAGCA
jgi:DNA-binding CsgD family transcriptional regulator